MAHVARWIEVDEPVDDIYGEWMRFEELPRCSVRSIESCVRWRAEVLTFEPSGGGTRVTLRIEYDPGHDDSALPGRLERALEGFRSFVAERGRA